MPLKLMSAIISAPQAAQACSDKKDANTLLSTLLFYVKQCQVRFGGKTELATEFDHNVAGLCGALETVLSHGLRNKPLEQQGSALKQMSDIVSNSLSLVNDTPTFWPFVKNHLTKHEQERYSVLKHIWTDIGKGKAWIRSALNERSLERYFHCLLSNTQLLNKYYEDWALLCDQEKSTMLPNMAAGLGPILFAISIDKPELNSGDCTLNKIKNNVEPIIVTASKSELKKKKRAPTQIILFDDDNDHDDDDDNNNDDDDCGGNDNSSVGGDNKSYFSYTSGSSISQEKDDKKKSKDSKFLSPSSSSLSVQTNKHSTENTFTTTDSKQYTQKSNQLNDNKIEVQHQNEKENKKLIKIENSISDVTLTPVQHTEMIGELIPIPGDIEQQCNSESPECEYDDTIEIPTDIVAVLTTVENKNKEEQNQLLKQISVLKKQNENLRIRLKKYISAVQMLKTDGDYAHRILTNLSFNEDSENEDIDHHSGGNDEVKIYEEKLVQVAEMHGELMEFNDHLQKMLGQKDAFLQRLRNELANLRGPLPSDKLSIEDEETFETVGLVSICVPSAFLTGSGSEAHYVYQIYIRAGNDEWNIYRRYAQFYALHCELKKLDPAVAAFDFPPKKHLGNKDANLVEGRRRRLQTYLRKILAHWPELGNCNSRYLLERHLSFFRDQPNQNTNSKKSMFSSKKTNSSITTNENHYTGL